MGSGQLSRDKVGCDLCPHPNCHPDPGHHLPPSLPPLGVRWVIMVIILIQDHHLPFHLPPPSVRGRRGGGGLEWTTVAASQATVCGKPGHDPNCDPDPCHRLDLGLSSSFSSSVPSHQEEEEELRRITPGSGRQWRESSYSRWQAAGPLAATLSHPVLDSWPEEFETLCPSLVVFTWPGSHLLTVAQF